jgi:hypothetical protein
MGALVLLGAAIAWSPELRRIEWPIEPPRTFASLGVDEVAAEVMRLGWGAGAFKVPIQTDLGGVEVVEFAVAPSMSAADLSQQLGQISPPQMTRILTSLRVSERMDAELEGSNFEVKPLTPKQQAVYARSTTSWKWEVKSKEHGTQALHLSVSAYIDRGAGELPLVVKTYSRTVDVEVSLATVRRYVADNASWVLPALAALAAAIWGLRKRQGSKPGEPPSAAAA